MYKQETFTQGLDVQGIINKKLTRSDFIDQLSISINLFQWNLTVAEIISYHHHPPISGIQLWYRLAQQNAAMRTRTLFNTPPSLDWRTYRRRSWQEPEAQLSQCSLGDLRTRGSGRARQRRLGSGPSHRYRSRPAARLVHSHEILIMPRS